jgi:hypothetical protein
MHVIFASARNVTIIFKLGRLDFKEFFSRFEIPSKSVFVGYEYAIPFPSCSFNNRHRRLHITPLLMAV